ncbi:MAG: EpsI family protein [Verrucomicrobiaceae bacterium]|nr:EpsI family protein [Verrucomicrobiaceae bacterium]
MKRLLILNAIVMVGLGSIFLLPASSKIQESAIIMDLPPFVGDWSAGPKEEASDKVKDVLKAKAYENRTYRNDLTGQLVHVSIVLSSDNVNQSIHRSERCLPAQGHSILSSDSLEIPVELNGTKKPLPVTKLITEIRYQKSEDDEPTTMNSSSYYWFIGKSEFTNNHFERTRIDMVDRLLRGYTQRWAYISLQTPLDDLPTGFDPHQGVADLIQEIVPEIMLLER